MEGLTDEDRIAVIKSRLFNLTLNFHEFHKGAALESLHHVARVDFLFASKPESSTLRMQEGRSVAILVFLSDEDFGHGHSQSRDIRLFDHLLVVGQYFLFAPLHIFIHDVVRYIPLQLHHLLCLLLQFCSLLG